MRIGQIGHQFGSAAGALQSVLMGPLLRQRGSQGTMCCGKIRIEDDGRAIVCRRFVKAAEREQSIAQAAMDLGRVLHAGQGARDQLNCVFMPAALMSDGPEQMQRVDLVRRAAQNLSIRAFGAFAPPRFMVRDTDLQISGNLCLPTGAVLLVG